MSPRLSSRLSGLRSSPVRDILSVAARSDMISFAGGLPALSTLPDPNRLPIVREDFQYGPSEGEPALRRRIAADLRDRGLAVDEDEVIVLSGSQQGIDLVAKLVIDPGTTVAVESPTYLAALQVFSLFGADVVSYAMHEPEKRLQTSAPAMLYCVPTFQNPTGHAYSDERRRALASACDDTDTTLFEDDPYRDLMYEPCDRTPIASFLRRSSWVYQSSFSKTLAPGLRLGYLVSSPDLHAPLLQLKQASDLHSNRLSQRIVLELLDRPDATARLERVRDEYRRRRDAFEVCLRTHFGDIARWNTPLGGLFFWLELKTSTAIDTRTLLPDAMAAGVAFMPGEPFFADDIGGRGRLRLSFGNAPPETFQKGLSILANIVRHAVR